AQRVGARLQGRLAARGVAGAGEAGDDAVARDHVLAHAVDAAELLDAHAELLRRRRRGRRAQSERQDGSASVPHRILSQERKRVRMPGFCFSASKPWPLISIFACERRVEITVLSVPMSCGRTRPASAMCWRSSFT